MHLRWHFLPFWSLPRTHLISRTSFSQLTRLGSTMMLFQYSVAGSALLVSRTNEYAVYQHSWDAPGVAHEWNSM